MPSRKKAKGKERKAKKEDTGKKVKPGELLANLPLQDRSKCGHGCHTTPLAKNHICWRFVRKFEVELNAVADAAVKAGTAASLSHFLACDQVIRRLKRGNQFDEIWNNVANQMMLIPLFVSLGTNLLLREYVRLDSMAGVIAIATLKCRHNFDMRQVLESKSDRKYLRNLEDGLVYDSVRYFYKKIAACNCLKDKYDRVKSNPKLGQCNYCYKEKERKDLLLCGRCKYHHYCGVECQKFDYSDHQNWCQMIHKVS